MKLKLQSQPISREAAALFALALSAPEITWPNDCPHCGAPMEFDLTDGAKAARRVCPLGHAVTAADVMQRGRDEHHPAKREIGRGDDWPEPKRGIAPLPQPVPAAA